MGPPSWENSSPLKKDPGKKRGKRNSQANREGNINQAATYNTPANQNQQLLMHTAIVQDNQILIGQIQVGNLMAKQRQGKNTKTMKHSTLAIMKCTTIIGPTDSTKKRTTQMEKWIKSENHSEWGNNRQSKSAYSWQREWSNNRQSKPAHSRQRNFWPWSIAWPNTKSNLKRHPKYWHSRDIGPTKAAHYQSEGPLAVTEVGVSQRGRKFMMPLYFNTGAGIDICSLNTAKRQGLLVHYETLMA